MEKGFQCPRCGIRLSQKQSNGLCPGCMLKLSVPEEAEVDTTTVLLSNSSGKTPKPISAESTAGLELLDQVGAGGFGTVFRALDHSLDREVAVKILHRQDPEYNERFESEAVITGNLQHQNIVPVHAIGQDEEGRRYFTMKILEGQSLAQILERLDTGDSSARTEYPYQRLAAIFLSVCEAVAYAHSQGVIHRDLKPANVMLGTFGEVYVMDWGLAKLLGRPDIPVSESPGEPSASGNVSRHLRFHSRISHLSHATMDGTVMGTPGYMSPEQASGEMQRIDIPADIYSLGAMLFEILTGLLPVAGDSSIDMMRNTVKGYLRSAGETKRPGPTPPKALLAIARKALANDPGDRYATVGEMARDVRNWLEDRPVSVAPDGLIARSARWMRHHRTAAATLATTVVLGVGATISLLALASHSARREARLAQEKARLASEKAVLAQEKAEAEEEARRLAQQDKKRVERRNAAITSYLHGRELEGRGASMTEEALAAFTHAIELDPNLVEPYIFRGDLHKRQREYDKAIEDYLAANEAHRRATGRDNAEALEYIGNLYWIQKGDIDNAVDYFERSAKADPDNARAQIAGAIATYLNEGREKGVTALRDVIARFPKYWEAHHALAMALLGHVPGGRLNLSGGKRGAVDPEGAILALNDAVALDPSRPELFIHRGMARTMVGDYQGCLHDYEIATLVDPDNFNAHLVRLQANYYMKNFKVCEESLAVLKRLQAEQPDGQRANRTQVAIACEAARLRYAQKRYHKALEEIETAIKLAPEAPELQSLQKLKAAIEKKLKSGSKEKQAIPEKPAEMF